MQRENNPLVSVVLITYNNEAFVREAIIALFEQDYNNMEIIISDDASSDRTQEIIKEVIALSGYNKKVILNINKVNQGIAKNIQAGYKLATGEILVNAAGDDIALPNRVSVIASHFLSNKDIVYLTSNAFLIDKNGIINGILDKNKESNEFESCVYFDSTLPANGCAAAISRRLIDCFAPVNLRVNAEDALLKARGHMIGSVAYLSSCLLYYRLEVGVSTQKRSGSVYLKYAIDERKDRLRRLYIYKKDMRSLGFMQKKNEADLDKMMKYEISSINLLSAGIKKAVIVYFIEFKIKKIKDWTYLLMVRIKNYERN